jgi:hypothetical protein
MAAGGQRAPTAEGIGQALEHVCGRLGDAAASRRARWLLLWAIAAAFPYRSPIAWAPTLGLDPNQAAVMLGRVRTMRWFDWRWVVEAMAILIADADLQDLEGAE